MQLPTTNHNVSTVKVQCSTGFRWKHLGFFMEVELSKAIIEVMA